MANYTPVYGKVTSISPIQTSDGQPGCTLLFSLESQDLGPVTLTVTPQTYVAGQETFKRGDYLAAFFDPKRPVPLIYPPRYDAVLMTELDEDEYASFDFYDSNLVNSDNTLKLNITPLRKNDKTMANGQIFYGNPGNHYLLVIYSATTRSIPAMTTPEEIIVFCDEQDQ